MPITCAHLLNYAKTVSTKLKKLARGPTFCIIYSLLNFGSKKIESAVTTFHNLDMSNIADSTALPSYEEMMNIFADLDEGESVPRGTQAIDSTKPVSQSMMETQLSDSNTFDASVRFEDTQQVHKSSARVEVDLHRAFAKQQLAETSSDAIPVKVFGDDIALSKKSIVSTRGWRTVDLEEDDEHERLPTCEDMLCIFANLESCETCSGENAAHQKPREVQQHTIKKLYAGKLHGDRVSSQSLQDGIDTPSSVMTMDLFVCK